MTGLRPCCWGKYRPKEAEFQAKANHGAHSGRRVAGDVLQSIFAPIIRIEFRYIRYAGVNHNQSVEKLSAAGENHVFWVVTEIAALRFGRTIAAGTSGPELRCRHLANTSERVDMAADDKPNRRQDRRRHVRIASLMTGNDRTAIPCVILDLSNGGARLHVHAPGEVPDRFRLLQIASNEERDCEVVWRRDNEMGVKFLP